MPRDIDRAAPTLPLLAIRSRLAPTVLGGYGAPPARPCMHPEIERYNKKLELAHEELCNALAKTIEEGLSAAQGKVWHAHPVWFLAGNPTVGYSRQKRGIRLMFWSGADFDEPGLDVPGAKFKDASVFWNTKADIDEPALERWLRKARLIQWNYRDLVKKKGRLERLD